MKEIERKQKQFLHSRRFLLLSKYRLASQQKPTTRESERRTRGCGHDIQILFLVHTKMIRVRPGGRDAGLGRYPWRYTFKRLPTKPQMLRIRHARRIGGIRPAAPPSDYQIDVECGPQPRMGNKGEREKGTTVSALAASCWPSAVYAF